jgi:hypothetical protein
MEGFARRGERTVWYPYPYPTLLLYPVARASERRKSCDRMGYGGPGVVSLGDEGWRKKIDLCGSQLGAYERDRSVQFCWDLLEV